MREQKRIQYLSKKTKKNRRQAIEKPRSPKPKVQKSERPENPEARKKKPEGSSNKQAVYRGRPDLQKKNTAPSSPSPISKEHQEHHPIPTKNRSERGSSSKRRTNLSEGQNLNATKISTPGIISNEEQTSSRRKHHPNQHKNIPNEEHISNEGQTPPKRAYLNATRISHHTQSPTPRNHPPSHPPCNGAKSGRRQIQRTLGEACCSVPPLSDFPC